MTQGVVVGGGRREPSGDQLPVTPDATRGPPAFCGREEGKVDSGSTVALILAADPFGPCHADEVST
jgi:hypothetical protein